MRATTKPVCVDAVLRAERASRRDAENPFARVVRETSLSTIITDPSGVDNPIVFANPAFCRLTGYRVGEVLGRNCRFLQGADTDAAAVAQIGAALRAQVPIEIDILNHRKNGTAFWNRLLIAPVYADSGSLAYFFASQIDVTAKRGAAGEKLQAALQERQRVKAALEHLHAVEAICHLAGGIAYNFDNLLGGIRGSLETLQHDIALAVGVRPVRKGPIRGRSASLYSARTE